jgi:hypothetical protein
MVSSEASLQSAPRALQGASPLRAPPTGNLLHTRAEHAGATRPHAGAWRVLPAAAAPRPARAQVCCMCVLCVCVCHVPQQAPGACAQVPALTRVLRLAPSAGARRRHQQDTVWCACQQRPAGPATAWLPAGPQQQDICQPRQLPRQHMQRVDSGAGARRAAAPAVCSTPQHDPQHAGQRPAGGAARRRACGAPHLSATQQQAL